jgi:AAA+ ATPase superfamily predicted ATPase
MIDNITSDEDFGQIIQGSWTREVFDIDTWLSFGHVIVYGERGSGKTTLLNRFVELNTRGFERIDFRQGYEIEMNESLLSPYLISRPAKRVNEGGELLIKLKVIQVRSLWLSIFCFLKLS